VPVAHTSNPSYSGGRDQEDLSSRPAQANSSRDPISKIPNTKKGCWRAQVVECLPSKCEALSSKPHTIKKKKKKRWEKDLDKFPEEYLQRPINT
jgi:hypothetical protein